MQTTAADSGAFAREFAPHLDSYFLGFHMKAFRCPFMRGNSKYVSSTKKALTWKPTRKGKRYRSGRVKVTNGNAGIRIPGLSRLKPGSYVLSVGGRSGSKTVIKVG